MKKVAAYTGTRNLYGLMVPAVKSLMYNSDVDEVWLFIEDDEFPYDLPGDVVHTRNASGQRYFRSGGPNMDNRFTYMAMMRATFAEEFKELDRILSLDVDTIVDADISDLWELPLGDKYYFAAAYEPERTRDEKCLYTNTGVCLYNLDKLRDGKCDEVINELNRTRYRFLEQDVFNFRCKGAIYDMPSEYNATRYTMPCEMARIIHYAGYRAWGDEPLVNHYRELPWLEILEHRSKVYGK